MCKKKKRLSEGNGEALYEIGVDDDGTIKGEYTIKKNAKTLPFVNIRVRPAC